jgi:hypothetical protein
VISVARGFKPTLKETREQFIRNTLKDRLNWPRRDPAPQAVLDAAKQMAAHLSSVEKEARAKLAAEQEVKKAQKVAMEMAVTA